MDILQEAFRALNEQNTDEENISASNFDVDTVLEIVLDFAKIVKAGADDAEKEAFVTSYVEQGYDEDVIKQITGTVDEAVKIITSDIKDEEEIESEDDSVEQVEVEDDEEETLAEEDDFVADDIVDDVVDDTVAAEADEYVDECVDENLEETEDSEIEEYDVEENTEDDYLDFNPDELNEDVASTIPVRPLPVSEVREFIEGLPNPSPDIPPRMFKLGYIREFNSEIPARFKGGRGSEGQPHVRIFKCTEYPKLYTGSNWRNTNATKAADKILGTERHTGEKTGFSFSGDTSVVNRIGTYKDGSEALQAYIADGGQIRTQYYLSRDDVDNGDLKLASKEDIIPFVTDSVRQALENPQRHAAGQDAEGNNIYDKPINRFKLTQIYMIGNHGHSIM